MSPAIDPRLILLSKKKVLEMTCLSNTTLYERIAAKRFPAGVKIGPKATAFRAGDIADWLADPTGYRAPAAA